MSEEAKYQTVFNKLVQLTAAKWNLQTVLKYKENIISSSTRNTSTPKRPDIYQHLKTVNVDTTPRRKRVLCSPTPPAPRHPACAAPSRADSWLPYPACTGTPAERVDGRQAATSNSTTIDRRPEAIHYSTNGPRRGATISTDRLELCR